MAWILGASDGVADRILTWHTDFYSGRKLRIVDNMTDKNASEDINTGIGRRLRACRQERGLSLSALAMTSKVSKAMLSRVERAECSATASLLGRIAAGMGIPLSELLLPAPPVPSRLRLHAEQPVWRDPAQGYRRRQVAPADAGTEVELVEVELPRRTRVDYPPWQGRPSAQRLWMLEGRLRVAWGEETFDVDAGDALDLVVDRPLSFSSSGDAPCRYLLVIASRGERARHETNP